MSQFTDFDIPATPVKPTAADIRPRFPQMSLVIDEFKAAFGESQVTVERVQEGSELIEAKSYKPDSAYGVCTGEQYVRMGELSRANSKYVNRARRDGNK
jgi:hypothetical protein